MNFITQKYVKVSFKTCNVQLPKETLELDNDHLKHIVSNMAIRCQDGNVKRCTPDLFWVALGRGYNK